MGCTATCPIYRWLLWWPRLIASRLRRDRRRPRFFGRYRLSERPFGSFSSFICDPLGLHCLPPFLTQGFGPLECLQVCLMQTLFFIFIAVIWIWSSFSRMASANVSRVWISFRCGRRRPTVLIDLPLSIACRSRVPLGFAAVLDLRLPLWLMPTPSAGPFSRVGWPWRQRWRWR